MNFPANSSAGRFARGALSRCTAVCGILPSDRGRPCANAILPRIGAGACRTARFADPLRADDVCAGRRAGLSGALSLGRHAGRADRRVGRDHRAARSCARRRQADRGLGAPDHRGGAALRAVACHLRVSANGRVAPIDRAGRRGRRNRLSRPRDCRSASLSGRRQRGAGGDRLGACRPQPAGCWRRQQLCRVGPFAGRTGVALHRLDREDLCAGASSGRRCGRSAGDLARHPDGRRLQEFGRQEPDSHDAVVVVAGLWRTDRQGGRAGGDADRRPAFQ